MDRLFKYVGESIYEWDFTAQAQNTMVGLGKLALATLGNSTLVNGLSCGPTSPASLQVQVGTGEIYQTAALEATAMATLPADTTDLLIKQGVNLPVTLLACAPPATPGQSINYLIEAQYQDQDVSIDPTTGQTSVVLAFYNSSNPTVPWSGPNNTGYSSNTFRKGIVALAAKAGIAATTGSQVTPSADAGWVGLWVVTVAYGQTTITSGNIVEASGAPFITEKLTAKISQATGDGRYVQLGAGQGGASNYAVATGGPNAFTAALSPAPASLTEGMRVYIAFPETNTAAGPTLNLNTFGAFEIYEADGATALPIGLLPLNAELIYHASGGGKWALISAAPITTGVLSVNGHAGVVVLSSGDIETSLGFTPLDSGGSNSGAAKITFFASTTSSASINIPQGAVPSSPGNGDIWTTSAGVFARIAGSTQQLATISGAVTSVNGHTGAVVLNSSDIETSLGYTPINPAGGTMTGEFVTAASSSAGAGFNLPPGAAPTSPSNGDLWSSSAGFFGRAGGVTQQLIASVGSTTSGDFAAFNSSGLLVDQPAATAAQIWAGTDNLAPVTSEGLALASAELPLTDGSTTTWNMDNGFNAAWTLGGNHTLAVSNPIQGRTYALQVIQPASGGPWTPTWPSSFNWMGVGAPSLSTTANLYDLVMLYCVNAMTPTFIATFVKGS